MSNQIVVFGAESAMAHEAVETCRRLGIEIAAAVVTGRPEWELLELDNIVHENAISDSLTKLPVICPVWLPQLRRRAVESARKLGFNDFMTIVDPTATVASSARLGKGVYVHTGANVGAGATIGDFALINRGALVSHHCHLRAYVTTGPGITMSSRCRIGEEAVLGVGCTLIQDRIVGERAFVGAGAVVIRDVDADTTVAGNPARVIKRSKDS